MSSAATATAAPRPMSLMARPLAWAAVLVTVATACPSPRPEFAPVPDRSQRLVIPVPPDEVSIPPETLDDWVAQVECLIGSDGRQAELCEGEATRESVPFCTTKAPAMAAPVRAILTALPRLELTTLDSSLVALSTLLPGLEMSRHVRDARRDVRCDTWGSEAGPGRPNKCAAIRTPDLWVLLSAPPGPRTRVDTLEVFLRAATVCEDRLRPGQHSP